MTKLLLVEDDQWLAELEAAALTRAGYDVVAVNRAPAAIEAVDREHPDAIVLDVLLTGSTGFALLHELQSYTDTKIIPVVLCTNTAERLPEANLESYGVRRVVDKTTMTPEDLVAAVRSVLA